MAHDFSGPVNVFHDRRLPETATPAGYAALIHAYDLLVPVPRNLSAIGKRHRMIQSDGWSIYTPRHAPQATLDGQLTFALKYEGLDLAALKRLFMAVKASDVADLVRLKPTGVYSRRIWFLYEWLLGKKLDLPDADRVTSVDVVDTELFSTQRPENVRRGTAFATTCRAHLNSARSSSRRRHSTNLSR